MHRYIYEKPQEKIQIFSIVLEGGQARFSQNAGSQTSVIPFQGSKGRKNKAKPRGEKKYTKPTRNAYQTTHSTPQPK